MKQRALMEKVSLSMDSAFSQSLSIGRIAMYRLIEEEMVLPVSKPIFSPSKDGFALKFTGRIESKLVQIEESSCDQVYLWRLKSKIESLLF